MVTKRPTAEILRLVPRRDRPVFVDNPVTFDTWAKVQDRRPATVALSLKAVIQWYRPAFDPRDCAIWGRMLALRDEDEALRWWRAKVWQFRRTLLDRGIARSEIDALDQAFRTEVRREAQILKASAKAGAAWNAASCAAAVGAAQTERPVRKAGFSRRRPRKEPTRKPPGEARDG